MLLLPNEDDKTNAATTNVTPVYEDDKEMQLRLKLLLPLKMKHMIGSCNRCGKTFIKES